MLTAQRLRQMRSKCFKHLCCSTDHRHSDKRGREISRCCRDRQRSRPPTAGSRACSTSCLAARFHLCSCQPLKSTVAETHIDIALPDAVIIITSTSLQEALQMQRDSATRFVTRNNESALQAHSRSLLFVPFDRSYIISY